MESDFLKSKFSFLLIPMVNEEGVSIGNYRTGLGGYDFNRVWDHPDPVFNDSIYHFKKWIKEQAETYEFKFILDLHGHSKKFLFLLLDFKKKCIFLWLSFFKPQK